MSEILIETQKVVCGSAMIRHILLQTLVGEFLWEAELGHHFDDLWVHLQIYVLLHFIQLRHLLPRVLSRHLQLIIRRRGILVCELMVNSIIEILVVQLLILPVNLPHLIAKPYHYVFFL